MLKLQTRAAPSSLTPPSADQTRRFLIESERRVILHCRRLLGYQDVPAEDLRRLIRIVGEAEARLQGLAS